MARAAEPMLPECDVFTKTMRISSKIITVLLIEYKKIAQILA
ncbi:hypothetical protein PTET_a0467 [Pseudoalteromonas tetraodonis]|nr:hypothetical protein PTET_a0467 [Pseudoalteromonas tetraodonis]